MFLVWLSGSRMKPRTQTNIQLWGGGSRRRHWLSLAIGIHWYTQASPSQSFGLLSRGREPRSKFVPYTHTHARMCICTDLRVAMIGSEQSSAERESEALKVHGPPLVLTFEHWRERSTRRRASLETALDFDQGKKKALSWSNKALLVITMMSSCLNVDLCLPYSFATPIRSRRCSRQARRALPKALVLWLLSLLLLSSTHAYFGA